MTQGLRDGQGGSVTVIQRFGSGLQLNVHYHSLLIDGVFTEAPDGSLRFHPAPPPTDAEVGRLLATIRTRIIRLLRRRGILGKAEEGDAPDPLAETSLAWTDGTTALLFEPVELLERLAALTPRPRINLVLHHGVFGPHSRWRARVVTYGREATVPLNVNEPSSAPPTPPPAPAATSSPDPPRELAPLSREDPVAGATAPRRALVRLSAPAAAPQRDIIPPSGSV